MRRLLSSALALVTAFVCASPRSSTAGPGDRRVPEVVGLPMAAAQAELEAGGFQAAFLDAPPGDARPGDRPGTVASQMPGGFAFAAPGSSVTVYVSMRDAATPPPSVPTALPPRPGVTPAPAPTPGPTAREDVVPNVRGKTESEAIELLAGWRITILTVDSAPENEGRVTYQTPAAGSTLAPDGVVEISVGRTGTPPAPAGTSLVPTVVGLTEDAASQALTAAQLVKMLQTTTTGDPSKIGKVISQDPAAGTTVAKNSNVVITVGRAVASSFNETEVPDCARMPEGVARKTLNDAGFGVVVKDRLASAAENGTVVEQVPAPNSRLLKGRDVTLTVGRLLMLPIAIPDVMSVDAAGAERALREAGFEVERVMADTLPSAVGKVIAQEPPGNTSRVRGSFVRITIGRSSVAAPTTIQVPDVVGGYEGQVRADLQARGFGVRVNLVPGASPDAGKVRGQYPPPGTVVAPGSEIALDVVKAEATQPGVPLPNYTNMDAATAQADLQAKGLRVAIAYTVGTPEGRVIQQNPGPGAVTLRGTLVTLTVARAPSLGVPMLLEPANAAALPKNHGVVFRWNPVVEADDYQIEVMSWKNDTWQRENQYDLRDLYMNVKKAKQGLYQWHVRARRAGGTIVGPWSEWRRLRVY